MLPGLAVFGLYSACLHILDSDHSSPPYLCRWNKFISILQEEFKKKKKKHAPHLARTKKFFLILQKHMSVCMFTLEESRTPIEVQSKCQLNVKCSKEIHDAADTAVQPPLLRANRTTNCVVWFSMKQHHCRLCHCWITLGSHYPTCPAFHSSEISCPTSCWLKLVRPCTNMCIS